MKKVKLTIDFGASATKAIMATDKDSTAIAMPPYLSEIVRIPVFDPQVSKQNQCWVTYGGRTFAVGQLAQILMNASFSLNLLKSELAVAKVLAVLWLAKEQFNLTDVIELDFVCLLPGSELADFDFFRKSLKDALKKFKTPTGTLKVKLSSASAFPEGFGCLTEFLSGSSVIDRDRDSVGVLMAGYRNISFFTSTGGNLSNFATSNLGMASLVQQVIDSTSGYNLETLTPAIVSYDKSKNLEDLLPVLRKKSEDDRERELKLLVKEIDTAYREYGIKLVSWLDERVAKLSKLDAFLLAGGTTTHITQILSPGYSRWLKSTDTGKYPVYAYAPKLPSQISKLNMGDRMFDVYALSL